MDEEAYLSERVAALNQPLARTGTANANPDEEVELDLFPTVWPFQVLTWLLQHNRNATTIRVSLVITQ